MREASSAYPELQYVASNKSAHSKPRRVRLLIWRKALYPPIKSDMAKFLMRPKHFTSGVSLTRRLNPALVFCLLQEQLLLIIPNKKLRLVRRTAAQRRRELPRRRCASIMNLEPHTHSLTPLPRRAIETYTQSPFYCTDKVYFIHSSPLHVCTKIN
jgi:hypothetical protein